MEVGYSTLCRNLHEWGFTRIQPRPKAVKADPVKRAAFVETVRLLLPKEPDLWFQDEVAFWADPAAYRVWAPRGSKPVVPRLVTHQHVNVFGAVRPMDGRFFAFIASHGNGKLFQHFLNQMQERIDPNRRTIMVLDNIRFHHGRDLDWG
ncbi:IS630 family transposase [bacterium]|nr:IS630 family transposase [bacterium]